jgi:hypothetical protein
MTEAELQMTALILEKVSYSSDGMQMEIPEVEYRKLWKRLFYLKVFHR